MAQSSTGIIQDFAFHPLMQKAQEALLNQLKATELNIIAELRERGEELKQKSQNHQFLGVQLYQLQHKIAKTQSLLDEAYSEYQTLNDARLLDDENVKVEKDHISQLEKLVNDHRQQQQKYFQEYSEQIETLRKMETYMKEMETEIDITKSAMNKKETSIKKSELEKENQDQYLGTLILEVDRLKHDIEIIQNKAISHVDTINEITIVIRGLEEEIELISSEKSQLLSKWKSTVAGIGKRDEAIEQIQQTMTILKNELYENALTIEVIKGEISKEQKKNETILGLKGRLEHEAAFVDESLIKTVNELNTHNENYALLLKSLSKTDDEEKKLDIQLKQIVLTSESTLTNLQMVIRERHKLEEELQTLQSSKTNLNKSIQTLMKENDKLITLSNQKENEIITLENELARITLEKLQLQANMNQLQERNEEEILELKKKEEIITKYQNDIKKRNDEIEKKVLRVDRLNQRYERMLESVGGEENLNSLENNIKHLNDAITVLSTECQDIKRSWLSKQTELVTLLDDVESLLSKQMDIKSRISVLSQQRIRYENEQILIQDEIRGAMKKNIDLRKETVKINSLISQQNEDETKLNNMNYNIEKNFAEEVRRIGDEISQLQKNKNDIAQSTEKIVEELHEIDNQNLLWEKKLQLDREMKAALQPLVGNDDIEQMEKEVHRMTLRLEAIKKHQVTLSNEMETAVLKRETIANRYRGSSTTNSVSGSGSSNGSSNGSSSASILRNKTMGATTTTASYSNTTKALNTLTTEYNTLKEELVEKTTLSTELQQELTHLQEMTLNLKSEYEASEISSQNHEMQLKLKLCEKSIINDKYTITCKLLDKSKTLQVDTVLNTTLSMIDKKYQKVMKNIHSVKLITNALKIRHKQLQPLLTQIEDMTTVL